MLSDNCSELPDYYDVMNYEKLLWKLMRTMYKQGVCARPVPPNPSRNASPVPRVVPTCICRLSGSTEVVWYALECFGMDLVSYM